MKRTCLCGIPEPQLHAHRKAKLCQAIVEGFKRQLEMDLQEPFEREIAAIQGDFDLGLHNLELLRVDAEDEPINAADKIDMVVEGMADFKPEDWKAEDELKGGSLPPELVKQARLHEI